MHPSLFPRAFALWALTASLSLNHMHWAEAASATVLGTNVYHQITALGSDSTVFAGAVPAYSNRQSKKLSADGSKLVFVRSGYAGTNFLYTINYDGSGMALIDTFTDGSVLVDISANGSKVLRYGGGVIRVMNSDGGSALSLTNYATSLSCRLSADGTKVFFTSDRRFSIPNSNTDYDPGIYVVNPDGTGLRQITGATPLGLDHFGIMGYWSTSRPSFWNVSADGSKLVFFLFTPNPTNNWRVIGMNTDGTGLHDFAFPAYPQTGYFGFYSVGISGDGSKVYYYQKQADSAEELAVYNWDGTGRRVLYQHAYGYGLVSVGSSAITLSHDGTKLLYGDSGYLYNTDGSGYQSLDYFNVGAGLTLPSGTEGYPMTDADMNSNATRFAFLNYAGTGRYQYQLVTLTPNPASLGHAPALSSSYAKPPYWIRGGDSVPVGVTVTTTNTVRASATTSIRNGVLDSILRIRLHDDGGNGDATAGDGTYSDQYSYSGNFLSSSVALADMGPRVMRFVAEVTGPDGMIHATAIDAAPFFFLTNAPSGPPPTISAIVPPSASPGAQITINGTGFDLNATNNFVLLGNQILTVLSGNGTQLLVQLPSDVLAVTGPITVTSLGQSSTPANFTITDPFAASLTVQMLASLQIFGTVGSTYRLDYLTDVQNTNSWSPLYTNVLPSSPYFWVDVTSTNQPRRYYRAVRVP